MIRVKFFIGNNRLTGFEISGHAMYAESGSDVVCAAVSSAAYMTANTVTEIVGAAADITVDDGLMELTVTDRIEDCQNILSGFQLHIQALSEEYPQRIHCN